MAKLDPLAILKGRLLSSGVYPDYKSQAAPLFIAGNNFLFSQDRLQTFLGDEDFFDTELDSPILGVQSVKLDGLPYVVFGTADTLYVWNESSIIDFTSGYSLVEDAAGAVLAGLWDFESWGSWIIANNGVNPLQIWKGSGFSTISDFESEWSSAYTMTKWNQYLQVFGVEGDLDRGAWCATNDPETWAATASNLAGDIFFRDIGGGLTCAIPSGNFTAVFGEDQLHGLFFNQTTNVFGQQHLVDGIGAFGKKSACDVNGVLYGAGPRGFWRTDGRRADYIHDPQVKRDVYEDYNFNQASKTIVYWDTQLQTVMFLRPSLNSSVIDKGIAFSPRDNSWSPFEIAATDVDRGGEYPYTVNATRSGRIVKRTIFDEPFGIYTLPVPAATVTVRYGDGIYGDGAYGARYSGNG